VLVSDCFKQLLATPSNCGDAHPTLEHQAARRKAPVAGVTTQGMVTASRGEALISHQIKVEVGHPQPSPTAFVYKSQRMLFTDYMAVGFSLRKSLRYSRAHPVTDWVFTQLQCLHRSVGEPAEGSLNLSTTTQRTNRTRPLAGPHQGLPERWKTLVRPTGRRVGDQRDVAPFSSRGEECAGRPPPVQPTTQTTKQLKPKRVCSKGRRTKQKTTLNNGYLGSRIDEERSEMRYVV
jgi:hypothetical protein